MTTRECSDSTAAVIAVALAGSRVQRLGDGSYLVPCPVPGHGRGRGDRNPSLQIRDGDSRLLVKCYASCDPRAVLDVLRRRGVLDESTRRAIARPVPARRAEQVSNDATEYECKQHRKAAWLWNQRWPIAGSIAETYLQEARAYGGPFPSTLGFLPPSRTEHHPAMIGAFAIPDEPEPGVLGEPRDVDAVHLTLLKPDGSGKAEVQTPKLVIGRPLGRPIVLAPPNDLLGLAIGEGIEDGLTAHQALGLGAWAAASAAFMPALADAVPSYIEAITIFAHPDKAGQDGARKLAQALEFRGIEVRVEGII
jgi:putative DNA primase/helicase